MSKDPVPGGALNNYDYAGQDPVNLFDLDGKGITWHWWGVRIYLHPRDTRRLLWAWAVHSWIWTFALGTLTTGPVGAVLIGLIRFFMWVVQGYLIYINYLLSHQGRCTVWEISWFGWVDLAWTWKCATPSW